MSRIMKQFGLWKLPRIRTGDNYFGILEDACLNENNEYNLHTDKGVIRNVAPNNILGTTVCLPFLENLTDKRLDFTVNIELKTGRQIPWENMGYNTDAVRRLTTLHTHINRLQHANNNLLGEYLNPLWGEKYLELKKRDTDYYNEIQGNKRSPHVAYGDTEVLGEDYEL